MKFRFLLPMKEHDKQKPDRNEDKQIFDTEREILNIPHVNFPFRQLAPPSPEELETANQDDIDAQINHQDKKLAEAKLSGSIFSKAVYEYYKKHYKRIRKHMKEIKHENKDT